MVNSAGHPAPDGCRPVAPAVCERLAAVARGRSRRRYVALFFVSGSTIGADDGRVVHALPDAPDGAVGLLRQAFAGAPDDGAAQYLVCDTELGECWACDAEAGLEFVTRHNRP